MLVLVDCYSPHTARRLKDTSIRRVYSLDGIYSALSPLELYFFEILEEELEKVEGFYLERSKEYVMFSSLLNEQLRELEAHRKIYDVRKVSKTSSVLVQDRASGLSGRWGFVGSALTNTRTSTASNIKTRAEDYLNEFSRPRQQTPTLDPDQYLQHKRKLKKAISEHYQYVPILHYLSQYFPNAVVLSKRNRIVE